MTPAVRKCNFFANEDVLECKMALTSLHDFYGSCHLHICHSLFDHSNFFVASLVFMSGHFVLCYKKVVLWQSSTGHRSTLFPL